MRDQSVRLSTGITMHYSDGGNPRGDTVLFLHGYTDTRRTSRPRSSTSRACVPIFG